MISSAEQLGAFPPDAYPVRVVFSFPSDVEEIPRAVERLVELARDNGYSDEAELELRLAGQEILANAVVHGNGSDPGKQVHCLFAFDPALGLLATVRDEGKGFRERDVPSPLEEEGVHASHGRGLHLIRELVDELWFERNGTQVFIRKSVR